MASVTIRRLEAGIKTRLRVRAARNGRCMEEEARTSIGTLFEFVPVCVGVWIMRRVQPEVVRPFRTPLVPLVPILAMIVCGWMIVSLDRRTQLTALGWMLAGLSIYFFYGRTHSRLATVEVPEPVAR